jgi:hypothetical protein
MAYKTATVIAAREWLSKNAPYAPNIVEFLGQREICEDVARYYPGGWQAFEESLPIKGAKN